MDYIFNLAFTNSPILPELELKTYYENLNISESDTIKYLQFRFR